MTGSQAGSEPGSASGPAPGPAPDVSIVIPAFDAGPEIEPCIRSLLELRFPTDRLEVVFVDDGSTDGTAERLDRLAGAVRHVRVIHIPASGGPGRPRNVGLAAARGEFVQFLDADDELLPDSIAALLGVARRNDSDVVLAKFASASMPRRQDLFTRSRARTTLAADLQIADGSLGPCRFFRTAFLRDRGLAFPEDWRVMEDQAFMLEALTAARVISVYADATCYRFNRRPGDTNLTSQPLDPTSHASHLATLLAIVDARTAPGPLRDRLQRRLYRVEVLERVAGPTFLDATPAARAALVAALAPIARSLPASTLEGTGALGRVRSRLLAEERVADIETLARREAGLEVRATAGRLAWDHGRLTGSYRAVLVGADGAPVALERRGGRTFLDPALTDDLVGPVEVGDELGLLRGRASLIEPLTMSEWLLDGGSGLELARVGAGGGRAAAGDAGAGAEATLPMLHGLLEIDPERVGPGRRPVEDGRWDLVVRWSGLGIRRTVGLRAADGRAAAAWPAVLGSTGRAVVPGITDDGLLEVVVGGGAGAAIAAMDASAVRRLSGGHGPDLALPIATDDTARPGDVEIRHLEPPGGSPTPARLRPWAGRLRLSARTTGTGRSNGPIVISGPGLGPEGVRVASVPPLGMPARLRIVAAWRLGAPVARVRTRLLAAVRRLPAPLKELIRRGFAIVRR